MGTKKCFEGTWGDDDSRKPLYLVQQKKGVLEWRNSFNELVAVNSPASAQSRQDESLQVLVALEKKDLDVIVAVWMARVWLDTQNRGNWTDWKAGRMGAYTTRRKPWVSVMG
ncbi:hypothetical protein DHEL01_v208973 [Diaporthe helianthi]|uniref:Uncharacterized protein n=1 Tax=Diaporthe helianthi TaxID=158607 RepID=A0A2P5HQU4_DIAHE|nr:hypothetical protein DHEL01_v208973 [Diaporthe helianthi]